MSEIQQKVCKICNQLKSRIQMGTFTNKACKRWVDESGKQWSGLVCPSCQANRAVVNMRRLREQRKNEKSN